MFTERQDLLLSLLREQGRSTGDALADTLKVSKRTVYRDLGALIEAGIPIRTEGGPGGGIWIDEPRGAAVQAPAPGFESAPLAAPEASSIALTEAEPELTIEEYIARSGAYDVEDDVADASGAVTSDTPIAALPAAIPQDAVEEEEVVAAANEVVQTTVPEPASDPIAAWFDAAFGRRLSEVHEVIEPTNKTEDDSVAAPRVAYLPQEAEANEVVASPASEPQALSLNLAAAVRERIFLDASGWWQEEMPSQVIVDLLQEAIFTNRAMRVQFHPGSSSDGFAGLGATVRVIEPYGLVAKAGIWYLVSRQGSHFVADRLSRIASAEQSSNRFDRVNGFDLETWWSRSGDQFARGNENYRFTALVRKNRVEFLRMYVGGRLQVDPVDSQWARARLEVASPEAAVMILLGLGQDAVVIEPDDLPLYVRRAAAGRPLHEASTPACPTPSYALG